MHKLRAQLKSFRYAYHGLAYMVRMEGHARFHCFAALVVIVAGCVTGLSPLEWGLLTLSIAFVLALEALNTAVETLCDALHPERHDAIGIVKDVAAGAVLVSAMGSVIIAALVFLPHWLA
ncbi:diacylglycerol kinase family protein [Thalassolituus sp. LLYu03]|uniref:diacylglycerol kinase family protein n=1 Tax=Thalassolituus sp. LLYu03 TaxID=3421656 RepID=UPI003D2884E5